MNIENSSIDESIETESHFSQNDDLNSIGSVKKQNNEYEYEPLSNGLLNEPLLNEHLNKHLNKSFLEEPLNVELNRLGELLRPTELPIGFIEQLFEYNLDSMINNLKYYKITGRNDSVYIYTCVIFFMEILIHLFKYFLKNLVVLLDNEFVTLILSLIISIVAIEVVRSDDSLLRKYMKGETSKIRKLI